jgi:hypothetical protein
MLLSPINRPTVVVRERHEIEIPACLVSGAWYTQWILEKLVSSLNDSECLRYDLMFSMPHRKWQLRIDRIVCAAELRVLDGINSIESSQVDSFMGSCF